MVAIEHRLHLSLELASDPAPFLRARAGARAAVPLRRQRSAPEIGRYGREVVIVKDIDDRIVAVGGEEPTRVLGTAEMYDIAEAKWITLPPMPTPRHAEAVVADGSTV